MVNIAGGTNEGPIDLSDLQGLTVPLPALRGHFATLITLGSEALARTASDVSFVHVYPGTVRTPLFDRSHTPIPTPGVEVPIEESGERNVFLSTSEAFPAQIGQERDAHVVTLTQGLTPARGTDGQTGSGVYSVRYDGSEAGQNVIQLLEKHRADGMVEMLWDNAMSETEKILQDPGLN